MQNEGVRKIRSVENEKRENFEVWKMGSVENAECKISTTNIKPIALSAIFILIFALRVFDV